MAFYKQKNKKDGGLNVPDNLKLCVCIQNTVTVLVMSIATMHGGMSNSTRIALPSLPAYYMVIIGSERISIII